jgi:hypothetical protein
MSQLNLTQIVGLHGTNTLEDTLQKLVKYMTKK